MIVGCMCEFPENTNPANWVIPIFISRMGRNWSFVASYFFVIDIVWFDAEFNLIILNFSCLIFHFTRLPRGEVVWILNICFFFLYLGNSTCYVEGTLAMIRERKKNEKRSTVAAKRRVNFDLICIMNAYNEFLSSFARAFLFLYPLNALLHVFVATGMSCDLFSLRLQVKMTNRKI